MPDRDPRGDSTLRGFARKIARLERDLKILEVTAQGAHRSVEEGAVDFYDEDGVLRERVGKQKNGSYGRLTLEGPVPPTPSEPDVMVIRDGVVAVTWDGRCEEKWPFSEFRNVRVHLGDTADFTPTRGNQEGTIHAHRGGTILCVTESDDDNPVYVRLVAVSTAGHTSDPSPAVLVDELDEDGYDDEEDEIAWEDGDGHTLTADDIAAGTVTFPLSHGPEAESMLAWWHPGGTGYAGVPQSPPVYTVDFSALTVTWALTAGREEVGDRLRVYYAYREDFTVLVPYQSTGWKYLEIATGDSTDRSAPGFDDSGWAIAAAPFGNSLSEAEWNISTAHATFGWPHWVTDWTLSTALWIRRTVPDLEAGRVGLIVQVRVDNQADVYWNGTFVANSGELTETAEIEIPAELVTAGDNVLAVRAYDLGTTCYLDARIQGA